MLIWKYSYIKIKRIEKKLLHRPLKVCSPNELFTLYEYLLYTNQSEILHIIEIY